MPIFNNILAGASGQGDTGYDIEQSLRFNDDSAAYLSKTFTGTPTLSTKATISLWWKRGGIGDTGVNGGEQTLISWNTGLGNRSFLRSEGGTDQLQFGIINAGGTHSVNITPVQRDVSAWYHIVGVVDTTQGTAADRMKLYINGEQVTAFDSASYPAQDETNIGFGEAEACNIGRDVKDSNTPLDGYLAEFHFIDGQALTPASFGKTNSSTNQWVPIEYDGSYGTNGFYQSYSSTELANSFTDSAEGHVVTANGNVHTDTSVKKIGTASAEFDGTGDYLSTPDSDDWDFGTGNFTWEAWVRLDDVSDTGLHGIISHGSSSSAYNNLIWSGATTGSERGWGWYQKNGSGGDLWSMWTLDQGSYSNDTWYHVAIVRNNDSFTLYVDGVSKVSETHTDALVDFNTSLKIGSQDGSARFWDGYMDEIRISDSARYTGAFTPSTTKFTADSNTLLLISSGSWDRGLGADSSGNLNNFTPTNLVATDQMLDSPTLNYCTMSPIDTLQNDNISLSQGNLSVSINTDDEVRGTIAIPTSGKWYWEYLKQDTVVVMVGVTDQSNSVKAYGVNTSVVYNSWAGTIYNFNSSSASYGSGWNTSGTIVGIAINMDDNEITFYNNGSSQGTLTMGGTASLYNMIPTNVTGSGQADGTFNFGQDSSFAGAKTAQGNGGDGEDFYYTPPTNFKALNTDNLDDPAIALPGDHFNTILWTGDDSIEPRSFTGVGFQPDFVWTKIRSAGYGHLLWDVVRGVSKNLSSDSTAAEVTDNTSGDITAFGSDGFTYTIGSSNNYNYGLNAETYVAWNWKAGGTASSNGDGSITSSVSANPTAGFSIVNWNGTEASATIGHGLSQAPELIIVKDVDSVRSWPTNIENITGTANQYLFLDTTAEQATSAAYWGGTPGASVFTVGDSANTNDDASMIAYCFHSVDGYSKVGSYTGNGAADGAFVYTGFRPAYILQKVSTSTSNWLVFDDKRTTYNVVNKYLTVDTSGAESEETVMDFLSNGFKFRATSASFNASQTYIYLAIAESPFKTSNAR